MDLAVAPAAPRLFSRSLGLLFFASFCAMASFYILLSVVPLYATSIGAAGMGAGLATGALMLSTVAAELVTPRLAAKLGDRLTLGIGLFLLGAPALALPMAHDLTAILMICLLRGLGFAIAVVIGGAMLANLVPPSRRGEGLGIYGVVVGVPGVAALPAGLWAVGQFGYTAVFIAGAVVSLAGIAVMPGLPAGGAQGETLGVLAGFRSGALMRPALVFCATAMAAGVVVTFLPLATNPGVAAAGLLVQAIVSTATRWWAGRYCDRNNPARLIFPAVAATVAGISLLVLASSSAAVMLAMVLFGGGFGVIQNASLSMMFGSVNASGFGAVSALWNIAYDAGIGLGAASFGLVVTQTGFGTGFLLTGALIVVVTILLRRVANVTSS